MLYHYTSTDGFYSIINNQNFRLTRSEFLNDPSDCRVLSKLINEYLTAQDENIVKIAKTSGVDELYKKAPLCNYIVYLQSRIPLYVFSLTENSDAMDMWNYYGNGGAQLELSEKILHSELSRLLTTENNYIAFAPVKYVTEADNIENIVLPAFKNYLVATKNKSNLFEYNWQEQKRFGKGDPLYKTTSLKTFVDTYVKGYLKSIETLRNDKIIDSGNSADEIYKAIFENSMNLNRTMLWKKDLTLYMLILSALIKSSTYEYEKEVRVVYFETSLTPPYTQTVNYIVQSLQGQKYIKPYIDTGKLDLNCINSLILSPLTRNLSIDSLLYTSIVEDFVLTKLGHNVSVQISKHKIRW